MFRAPSNTGSVSYVFFIRQRGVVVNHSFTVICQLVLTGICIGGQNIIGTNVDFVTNKTANSRDFLPITQTETIAQCGESAVET